MALQKVEQQIMNAPIFMMHVIRDDIYAEFAGVPLPLIPEGQSSLEELAARIAAVPLPFEPTKLNEALKGRAEIEQIISGLKGGTLRNHLKTTLPYTLTRQPVNFRMEWEGIDLSGTLTPKFAAPVDLLVQAGPPTVLAPRTSTRWQYGQTSVELAFSGLIDPSIQVPALQLPSIDLPFDEWPNGVRLIFEVIYQCCLALRQRSEFISIWVPAPADLGDIESWLSCPDPARINYIRRSNPSMVFEAFVPSTTAVTADLDSVKRSPWYMRCRALAEQYSTLGETREALFWLNVGVESLLKERMEAQIAIFGAEIDLDTLDGSDAYWDKARELVQDRFPDLDLDEIEWPTSSQLPSMFRQLKYFCRVIPEAPNMPNIKWVLSKYSKVCRKRNALFHGASDEPISIDDLKAAIEGFDWLVAEFCS